MKIQNLIQKCIKSRFLIRETIQLIDFQVFKPIFGEL